MLLTMLVAIVAGVAAACGGATIASGPVSARPPSPAAAPTNRTPAPSRASARPRPSPTATPTGKTDTDWGRIWDDVPAAFPRYPGAEPTETGEGPASAVLAVPASPAAAAQWYVNALAGAGYGVVGGSGPFENGSYVVEATGPGGCQLQVTVARIGSITTATIMFGGSCAFG